MNHTTDAARPQSIHPAATDRAPESKPRLKKRERHVDVVPRPERAEVCPILPPRYDVDVLENFEPTANYLLDGASESTMLATLLSPWEENAIVQEGIRLAADELVVLNELLKGGTDLNPEIVSHVACGIENRLRVLSEIAGRVAGRNFRANKEVQP